MRNFNVPTTLILAATLVSGAGAASAQMQMPSCHSMAPGSDPGPPSSLPAPEHMAGIGNLQFAISSPNKETQAWFNQGINLIFDFWDYEAQRAFEQAVRTDPNCAICHWGLYEAYSTRGRETAGYAHDELTKAIALRSHADAREQLYIDAAAAEEKAQLAAGADGSPDREPAVTILRKIIQQYPADQTARLILSETLQDGYEDGKPSKGTQETMTLLQEVLKQYPDSSAANHLWIHAVEASPHPEQALHSADVLASLAPNSGHMTHMPGHIFYRTGNYARAQVSFDLSESVDEAYMRDQNVAIDDDWNYVHNLMYSIANLMEEGHLQQAAIVSGKLANARGHREDTLYPWSTRDAISRINPQLPIALRTGDWPQVTLLLSKFEVPTSMPNLQFLARSLMEFAQGMQKAESKDFAQAEAYSTSLDAELWRLSQQVKDQESAQKKRLSTPTPPANASMSPDPVLKPLLKNIAVMSLELRASILVGKGQTVDAEQLFAQARQEEQELGYHEPPAFIRPVGEQEAVALMSAGQYAQARAAWQHALEDRPNSGFSLYGLAEVAEKSNEGQQATAAYQQFLTAWKTADPNLQNVQHARQWIDAHQAQSASAK